MMNSFIKGEKATQTDMPLCRKVIAPLLNHEVIVVNHSYFMLYVTIHTQTDSCQTSWIKKKSLE